MGETSCEALLEEVGSGSMIQPAEQARQARLLPPPPPLSPLLTLSMNGCSLAGLSEGTNEMIADRQEIGGILGSDSNGDHPQVFGRLSTEDIELRECVLGFEKHHKAQPIELANSSGDPSVSSRQPDKTELGRATQAQCIEWLHATSLVQDVAGDSSGYALDASQRGLKQSKQIGSQQHLCIDKPKQRWRRSKSFPAATRDSLCEGRPVEMQSVARVNGGFERGGFSSADPTPAEGGSSSASGELGPQDQETRRTPLMRKTVSDPKDALRNRYRRIVSVVRSRQRSASSQGKE